MNCTAHWAICAASISRILGLIFANHANRSSIPGREIMCERNVPINKKKELSMQRIHAVPLAAIAAVLLSSCAGMSGSHPLAVATLNPTQGNTAKGTVTFEQKGPQVLVDAHVEGLAPGQHGFHIHEKGDCSAPDATSDGGHFNPAGKPHGDPAHAEHHAGDFGNIVADANGKASLKMALDGVTLEKGAPNSLIGKGLIVHADPDDLKTQPTGNSGKRVACGVIQAS